MKHHSVLQKPRFILLGCIILCMATCYVLILQMFPHQPVPDYGKGFNSERKKRGIPNIPDNWDFRFYLDEVIWSDPDDYLKPDNRWGDEETPETPVYYQKHVIVQDENLIKETDIYLGSNIYEMKEDMEIPERVLIICIYSLDIIENVICTANVYTFDLTYINGDVQKAKEILNEWGIPRP